MLKVPDGGGVPRAGCTVMVKLVEAVRLPGSVAVTVTRAHPTHRGRTRNDRVPGSKAQPVGRTDAGGIGQAVGCFGIGKGVDRVGESYAHRSRTG